MERDLVKRFVKKDGSQRISFYRDEYAENPRDMTDEPLHCEDWCSNFSLMNNDERKSKSSSARSLLEYMLRNYGDNEKIVQVLIDSGKKEDLAYDNCLMYDKSRRGWKLMEWQNRGYWNEEFFLGCRRGEIGVIDLLDILTDDTINYLVKTCMTDKVKMVSYSFGYNGEVSFDDDVTCDAEGIAWLEKDEFLKYSGCKEEYWNGKTLDEIAWLLDEIEAWSEDEVYCFVVEDCMKCIVNKRYPNGEKDDEEHEEEEWEESDSCWGFYGDIDEVKASMFDQAGLDINEFEEVKI